MAGKLNPTEEAQLETRFANLDKPLERNFHAQSTTMKGAVMRSMVARAYASVDAEWGGNTANRIEYDAYQKLNAARAKNEDLNPLLDPNSPKYLFSPSVINSYMTPPKAEIAAGADKIRAGEKGPAASGTIGGAPASSEAVTHGGYRFPNKAALDAYLKAGGK
jgi:hypothetical protein